MEIDGFHSCSNYFAQQERQPNDQQMLFILLILLYELKVIFFSFHLRRQLVTMALPGSNHVAVCGDNKEDAISPCGGINMQIFIRIVFFRLI